MRADGLLFDKDGTLFDFAATWNVWAANTIRSLADGDAKVERRIAKALIFDLEAESFLPESFVIASTNRQVAEAVARVLVDLDVDEIEIKLTKSSAVAPMVPAVPLSPLLSTLETFGLKLGVMTNDSEFAAREQLKTACIEGYFDFIAGFDSGFGAKPDPDPLLAFAQATGLLPKRIVMVGDSTHDLIAGRRAGMQTAAVLTGMAEAEDLAPYADVVLPNIGHLLDWLSD